ncbi:cellulose biosynthesis protein BcsG [uncultured Shewanella sp.]|uniref:cellulose biosynthesis protein BcsG n=1 Tax=uncultured Shewanella sp. TaxID=173975 RepID=UPI00261AB5DD|nr:cellulose biosynthesis protein BcsG [uncultured Shewanella sp.]
MTRQKKQHNNIILSIGWWNLYFIIKVFLYLKGSIDFHPIENFSFLAFLLLPINHSLLNIIKQVSAFPLALFLLYYDAYFPPISQLWNNIAQISQFDNDYLYIIIKRSISTKLLLSIFTLSVFYYLMKRYIKITVLTISLLIFVSTPLKSFLLTNEYSLPQKMTPSNNALIIAPTENITTPLITNDVTLNELKNDFFSSQAKKIIPIENNNINAPFDILILSICSLAWNDLKMTKLSSHPIFNSFDIMFDNFNSATSYSGPALIRLLRANCGQETHEQLFENPTSNECYLFENLKKIGFNENLLLNHDAIYDSFLNKLQENGKLDTQPIKTTHLPPYLKSFDGSIIFRDKDVLNLWWSKRRSIKNNNIVALYNTISLHDGNRIINTDTLSNINSYQLRLKNLLDDLYQFFKQLNQSKRKLVVLLIPEHGANLKGDQFQIPGMREIPSPAIINIPVGIKFFGYQQEKKYAPLMINAPSSYLAIAKLISNLMKNSTYQSETIEVEQLAKDLPITPIVAQNASTTLMKIQNTFYISLNDDSWIEYQTENLD